MAAELAGQEGRRRAIGGATDDGAPLLEEDVTCWRVARAGRAALLIAGGMRNWLSTHIWRPVTQFFCC